MLSMTRVQARACAVSRFDEPDPAGPELRRRSSVKFRFEQIERAEITRNRIGQCPRRRAPAFRGHVLPEQAVVHMPARVVLDGHANVLRKLG